MYVRHRLFALSAVAALVAVVLALSGCALSFFAPSTPANPGQSTAPTEVIALAGADVFVVEGRRVQLNGAASRALVGVPTLSWTQREGPPVVLSNPSSLTPAFTAPLGPVSLVFELRAQADDKADTDEVSVDVGVEQPAELALPFVAGSSADVLGSGLVVLGFHWPATALAVVTPRCRVRGVIDVAVGPGDRLQVSLEPASLPCSVVVDEEARNDGGRRVSRVAAVVWPADVAAAAATRVALPALVAPGAVVPLDSSLIVAAADGTALDVADDLASFTAPRQPGLLLLTAEHRVGSFSGGVNVVSVNVVAAANAAPVVDGGTDLRLRPNERFRIAARGSDADDDIVTLEIRQVLGSPATPVAGFSDVLTAPAVSGTLLFHVIAFDGVAASAPAPVRVVVDSSAENRAPELLLPSTVFAVAGSDFTLDASGAVDDSGLVASFQIAQDLGDDVVLLPLPVDISKVVLPAGAAGGLYHFRVSAFDEGGLGVSVEVLVVVEDAGPFVDALRGSDVVGTGSAAAPFASVGAALETAARHRFKALLLARGEHLPFSGLLPDGLGLTGGFVFRDGGYFSAGGGDEDRALLPVSDQLFVVGGDLEDISVDGTLVISQDVRIVACDAGVVRVDVGGRVTVFQSTFHELAVVSGAAVVIDSVVDTMTSFASTVEVEAGVMGRARAEGGGLFVVDAASVLGPTTLTAGTHAVLHATLRSEVAGVPALGVDDASVTLGNARIVGSDVAVILRSAALLGSGTISSGATGIRGSGSVDLTGAHITVAGDSVDAAAIDGALSVTLTQSKLSSSGVGLRANQVLLEASIIKSAGVAFDVDSGALRHVTVLTGARAFQARVPVSLDNCVVQALELGDLPEVLGRVGLVVEGAEAAGIAGCLNANCIFGAPDALLPDGHLNIDPLLAHPFVDAGADIGVPFDIDGDAIPPLAADLGADEVSLNLP